MVALRPIRANDLGPLLALSRETTHGLTTLPTDERILGRRIENSLASFERLSTEPVPGDEYFLVLEDLDSSELVGTSAIVSKVGGFKPFYAYRIETSLHESKALGVRKQIRTLHLVVEHDGPSEIGTLFLSPRARRGHNGRLLSIGRFLLIAEHPEAFDPTIIAEMRGIIDEEGRSPFWEAIGRHFFDVDLPTADYKSIEDKSFIADLMPTHPIYIPMLPKEAQDVIGSVHSLTEPALHMLEAEGFHESDMVDIFEAGPVIECARDEIRAVRESRIGRVAAIERTADPKGGESSRFAPDYVVANRQSFRACAAHLETDGSELTLDASLAQSLDVSVGDEVRFTPIRPGGGRSRARASSQRSSDGKASR